MGNSTDYSNEAGTSMRSWMHQLEQEGQLKRVAAKVDWDLEIGAIARANMSQKGPGLLFENIKDYEEGRCTKMMTCGLGNFEQVGIMLNKPKASSKEIIDHLRKVFRNPISPVMVETGPVKENILTGDDINLYDFPAPQWNDTDGGRYIDTFAGVVTKDPETGKTNIGIYRGQILDPKTIGKLLLKTQGWGDHFIKRGMKPEPMPVAIVYGWHDVMPFCASTPFLKNVSEWDMMGAVLGQPVEMVKCETVDLEVPATAEIVVEGLVNTDPESFEMEGPFAEFPGYCGGKPSPKPAVKVQCITHRDDPVFRGALEGSRPGFPSEDLPSFCHCWSAVMWNILDDMGVRGITDVWIPPVTSCTHIYVQINKQYRGHAKQIATALWGLGISQFSFKHVVVVEQDINLRDPEAIEWAIAYRVNAGAGGIVTWGPTFGSPLDPSTPGNLRDPKKYGSGQWTRVLIDATRSWELEPNPKYDGRRFPPVTKLAVDLEEKIKKRWKEYGIGVPYLDEEKRELLTFKELSKSFKEV